MVETFEKSSTLSTEISPEPPQTATRCSGGKFQRVAGKSLWIRDQLSRCGWR